MKSAFKVKADGWLVKKNNCTGWESGAACGGGASGYRERMMGSDSGLSRGSGCPEKCEAPAIRWQNRTGCQSGKVALIWRKAKESACQPCSAKPKEGRGGIQRERYRQENPETERWRWCVCVSVCQ